MRGVMPCRPARFERLTDLRRLIRVIDLLASDAPADPGRRYALGIPDQPTSCLKAE